MDVFCVSAVFADKIISKMGEGALLCPSPPKILCIFCRFSGPDVMIENGNSDVVPPSLELLFWVGGLVMHFEF